MTHTYTGLKECNCCMKALSLDEFYQTTRSKTGRMKICKRCYQNKYAPKKDTQISSLVLQRDTDIERNYKLRTMTNDEVMTIVRGSIADERGRKDTNKGEPIIHWSVFIETKLVNPTKF